MPFIFFDVTTAVDGPLGLSLRPLFLDEVTVLPSSAGMIVVGFQKDEDGNPRDLQSSKQVQAGDALVAVNGEHVGRDGIVQSLQRAGRPVTLQFARATRSLQGMILATLLPAVGTKVHVNLLRSLIRRAAQEPRADALEATGYRGICWMILLGVLGTDPMKWKEELDGRRKMYYENLRDFFRDITELNVHDESIHHDKAALEKELGPNTYKVFEYVERDVHRTFMRVPRTDMSHFRSKLQRVLTVFACLNRGVSYVQGMNEIAGGVLEVLYACALHTPPFVRGAYLDWDLQMEHLEADTFWMFSAIVCGPCRDAFIADNDASAKAQDEGINNIAVDMSIPSAGGGGLVARLGELQRRVRLAAPAVDKIVHQQWNLRPHIYAARWYSVLMRREYWMDSLGAEWNPQLWDCMFAFTGGNDDTPPGPWDEPNVDFLLDLCCAYITLQRKEIEACADVNEGLMLLISQRKMTPEESIVPPPKVSKLIAEANRVRAVRQKAEMRDQIKSDVSRAVKGFFSSITTTFQKTTAALTDKPDIIDSPFPVARLSSSVSTSPAGTPLSSSPADPTAPIRRDNSSGTHHNTGLTATSIRSTHVATTEDGVGVVDLGVAAYPTSGTPTQLSSSGTPTQLSASGSPTRASATSLLLSDARNPQRVADALADLAVEDAAHDTEGADDPNFSVMFGGEEEESDDDEAYPEGTASF